MRMDSTPSVITRTKSEQLKTVAGAAGASTSLSRAASAEVMTMGKMNSSSGLSITRKLGLGKKMAGNSPGRKSSNHHIRQASSAQIKLDLEDVSSGAAISRASSASLGFSFSFTGFTAPPEDFIADLPFSDEENAVDPAAGEKRKRMTIEPTLPIYLKREIMSFWTSMSSSNSL